jgi:branched-chain amino acid transport system ATP-binding protein
VDIALYRRLVSAAGLLLLDEPSLGLAPILINKIFDMIDMIQKIHQEEK